MKKKKKKDMKLKKFTMQMAGQCEMAHFVLAVQS